MKNKTLRKVHPKTLNEKLLLGRSEWCGLPDLDIPAIKAKIDTGAKTSAIHAFNIRTHTDNGQAWVDFELHPLQANNDVIIQCQAAIIDERSIMSSNGHKEHRYVIKTPITIGQQQWEIEVTLSNRDPLKYRMLLGRESLSNRTLVDPSLNCNQGKISKIRLDKYYLIN